MSNPKVILTRSEEDIQKDKRVFEELGLSVIELPLIEVKPIEFEMPPLQPDYIVFQSKRAVEYFLSRTGNVPGRAKILCVGRKTAEALEKFGYRDYLLPSESSAKGLIELFKGMKRGKVLIPRSEIGRRELIDFLTLAGFEVYPVDVYSTRSVIYDKNIFLKKLEEGDFIVFASPSAVNGFFANMDLLGGERVKGLPKAVVIGKTTKKALEDKGFEASLIPPKPSMEAVAEEIKSYWLKNCK